MRDREQLKRVRDGFYTLEEIHEYFKSREKALQKAYDESDLPWGPREKEIKELLVSCIVDFYEK